MEKPRVIFMGSPEISVPLLRAAAEAFNVVGVVTQPDREAGRGKKVVMPAVKQAALELGIPVIQPNRMKDPGVFEQLQAWEPDLMIVMAFGQILRKNVLDLPKYGCLNAHGSLLPRWRGAAPIQAAILNGDSETGITVMVMDPGIDTGPMLSSRAIPIAPDDTTESLGRKLADLAAALMIETIPGYLDGTIVPQDQPEEGACYVKMIDKQEGAMDFSDSAAALERKVRAFDPWPSAFFMLGDAAVKVRRAHVEPNEANLLPGTRLTFKGQPAIAAADGILVLDEIQAPGKKSMPGKAFLAGYRNWNNA